MSYEPSIHVPSRGEVRARTGARRTHAEKTWRCDLCGNWASAGICGREHDIGAVRQWMIDNVTRVR